MSSPEIIEKCENADIVGYCHNFRRYVEYRGRTIDRLEQILKYGLLSQKEAEKHATPYKKNLNIEIIGVSDLDNLIFLFPLKSLDSHPEWPDSVSVVFDQTLSVITSSEMNRIQDSNWVNLSPTNGEVYVYGRIDPSKIIQICLPVKIPAGLEQVKTMVKKYLPSLEEKILIK